MQFTKSLACQLQTKVREPQPCCSPRSSLFLLIKIFQAPPLCVPHYHTQSYSWEPILSLCPDRLWVCAAGWRCGFKSKRETGRKVKGQGKQQVNAANSRWIGDYEWKGGQATDYRDVTVKVDRSLPWSLGLMPSVRDGATWAGKISPPPCALPWTQLCSPKPTTFKQFSGWRRFILTWVILAAQMWLQMRLCSHDN